MKIKSNKLIIILSIISIIGTILVFEKLPDKIPGHFNLYGQVDRYDSKTSIFFTGALPLILYSLMLFLPKIDPKRQSYLKHIKAYGIFQTLIVVFLILMHWMTILISLGYSMNVGMLIRIGVGILFMITGNYMGQIRHNYFFGIKTPWALANETVWRKTNRVGGISFMISGFLLILTSMTVGTLALVTLVLAILIAVLYPTIYSYIEYKKISE